MWLTLYTNFMKSKFILIGCLILIGYLLPYYILGEDTHIRVHDNLDSNIVWYKLLVESGQIFSLTDAALPNVINGLPRSALASGLDAMVWLYLLFEPMTAYTIGQTVMRFTAFFGMYLLLKRFIIRVRVPDWVSVGVALGFAMLPFWPSGMLSIAGLPLALYIFLTIRKDGRKTPKRYWVLLFVFPFLSNFILTMVFFLGVMGIFWLVDWIRLKRVNWPFFIAIASMTVIYLIKNYLLIFSMFFDEGFTSHRSENSLGHKDLPGTIELFIHNFFNGHTHDLAVHSMIIIPVIGMAFLVAAYRNIRPKLLLSLFIFNVLLSLWYAFWYWEGWRVVKDNFMIANTFNFSRIHFFDPAIWYICFALALAVLWKHLRFGKVLVACLILLQYGMLFVLNEESKYSEIGTPTFKEFYSEELFSEIEDYIGMEQSDYRVVSIGIHPTIAQYNGFYTLDTYNNSFPLEYKHQFREIIAPELEKNPELKSYFDTWGGRLYMYVGQLGKNYLFTKNSDEVIEALDINTEALQDLGGDYIFSALPIENYDDNGLDFEESFEKEGLPWEIWVYRVE
ncbi:hypothetical protein CIL05_04105 [Virgibacillus profundi]|uniref:YkoS n=1 Tax=Virgibacillus profundi TaxID=2024555 RepID=A0A2A2IIH3_9BACI|nr:DUF6044 family protein [Virgibacillus profundi]PAV30905.1 hypothetical protein CIL05_04105 [Virgibacillus profundi]PXY55089.1 hypothetical protein CIT14_04185 [Virgibacillus profundi]